MTTPQELITAAEKHRGKPYLYNAKGPHSFDCSGLITFAGADIGVWVPHGSSNQIEDATDISVSEAIKTPGALLYLPGHIAISKGDGTTIEARNPTLGVNNFSAANRGFTRGGLLRDISYPNHKRTETEPTMISPTAGRVSSPFGRRVINGVASNHAGLDIATGKTGVPVYAPFAGTVSNVVSNRVHDRSAEQVKNTGKPRVAPHVSGNGMRVKNPDGETQLFCHVQPRVRNGQKVSKGQLLGYVDLSGNTSGPHLHFETWSANGAIQNPMFWFNKHRVVPGSTPKLPAAPSAPANPSKPTTASFLTLSVDGDEGHRTVTEEQRALAKTKEYTGIIEADHGKTAVRGPELKKAFQRFYKRKGFYSGNIDGDFSAMSITSEQRCLKNAGYYTGIVEADRKQTPVRGKEQIKAVQRALNAGFYR